ncbi:translation initiation factor [Nostoc piscinale]|uniref:translation initiation factor n=1 Tax=Nostoc piscinale TaxID=224012 RepID=UPI0039A47B70
MVNGFFQRAKEFFTGSNNNEFDQETDKSNVRPDSEDDYLEPEDQIYEGLSPANQEPSSDTADEYSNISPTSADPFGDPADEYGRK